jgi:hypothetical protein
MKRLVPLAMVAAALLAGSGALACERHRHSRDNTTTQPANGQTNTQSNQN